MDYDCASSGEDNCDSDQKDYYSDYYDEEPLGFDNDEDSRALLEFSKGPSCKVITKESLLAAQRDDLRRVMDLLSIREHHARTLLIHYRWNIDMLLGQLVERGKACLFADAGVTVVESSELDSSPSFENMCYICMEDVPYNDLTKMDCGHSFCNDCWTEHFIVKIDEGQSKRIRCMAHKCNAICDEGIVRNLVGKRRPDLAEKFDRFLLESYIEDNRRVKWCPSVPHCGNAIRVEEDEFCEVECSCGLQFCFNCLNEAHSPCSCFMWKLWLKKCHDESETVNWMTVHTKPCPKCGKPVEKNGGCNLVCCVCGQAFCWVCGGATGREHTWSTISGHSCGRFKEDIEKQAERARRELYRYMHYHNRYKAHTDSLKLESNLMDILKDKVEKLERKESTIKDFSWVTNGLSRLFRSRRVLSYSYPFAFYMFDEEFFKNEMTKKEREIKQNLFEDQQQQLEANIERLSELLEKEKFDDFDEDKIMEFKMRIFSVGGAVDNLCKKMYECIENELLPNGVHNHNIASYKSKGIEKAAKLSVSLIPKACSVNKSPPDFQTLGVTVEADRPSGSRISEEKSQSNRKRARKGNIGQGMIDLNLPAEVITIDSD